MRDEEGNPTDSVPTGHHWARIVEVTHTDPAEKVFEMVVKDTSEDPVSFMAFRSERVPDLRKS